MLALRSTRLARLPARGLFLRAGHGRGMATNGSSGSRPQPAPGFARRQNPFAAAAAAAAAATAAAVAGSVAPDAARCDGVEDDAIAAAAPSPGWSVYGTVRWAVDPLIALVCGDVVAEEDALREAVAADPENATSWNNLGHLLILHKKDFDGAEAAYNKALEIDPEHADMWLNLGILLQYDKNEEDGAKAALRKVLAINPNHPQSAVIRALLK